MHSIIIQKSHSWKWFQKPLLIINFSLLIINCSAQCFQGKVTSDANAVCAGNGVNLSCMLIENQSGSIEDSLKLVAWQYSTTPDNPGSWTTMAGSGKILPVMGFSYNQAKAISDLGTTLTDTKNGMKNLSFAESYEYARKFDEPWEQDAILDGFFEYWNDAGARRENDPYLPENINMYKLEIKK